MEGLKVCPECRGEIPVEAEVCGLCQHAFKGGERWRRHRNKRLLIVTAVTLVFAAVVLAGLARAQEKSERDGCENAREFVQDLGFDPASDC